MSAERAPDRLRRIYNIRNYQWFAISTALMLFPALCAVLLLNRVGSAADLGLYSYAYALTAPLQAFLGLCHSGSADSARDGTVAAGGRHE